MSALFFQRAASVSALALSFATLAPGQAFADFKVRTLSIVPGELEFEHNGSYAHDSRRDQNNEITSTYEVGYSFNGWWAPELEFEVDRDPGPDGRLTLHATTFENLFQFTENGEYWADYGFYTEYAHAGHKNSPNTVEFGPVFQKDIGRTTQTLNLLVEKAVGAIHDDSGWHPHFAWQTKWNLWRQFAPSLEIYNEPGRIDRISSFQNQDLRIGPVAVGTFLLGPLGKIKYEAGYLFGATNATQNGTVKWRLEWETRF